LDADPESILNRDYRRRGVVTQLPVAQRVRCALVTRCGVNLAVVLVPEGVLDDPRQCAQAAARAYLIFHIPTVLISILRHRQHGEIEALRVLDGIDIARLPWRLYEMAA
jgi:hypothetical protein